MPTAASPAASSAAAPVAAGTSGPHIPDVVRASFAANDASYAQPRPPPADGGLALALRLGLLRPVPGGAAPAAASSASPAAAALASAVAATAAASADLTDADRSCVVCMDAPREVRFDPCSHAALQHVKTPSGATAPWQGLALGCAKHSGRAV